MMSCADRLVHHHSHLLPPYLHHYGRPAPWTKARDVCRSLGAELVSITSPEEAVFVKRLIAGEVANTWTGCHVESQANGWTWVSMMGARIIPLLLRSFA